MTGAFDFGTIATAKREAHGRLLRAVAGTPEPEPEDQPEHEPPKRTSMDGGARQSLDPPAPTHAETLTAILASRSADAGSTFGA